MTQAKEALDQVDFHRLDAFVATVAGAVSAGQAKEPAGADKVELYLGAHYKKSFEVELGLQHGPGAPLMVILPGIYGGKGGGYSSQLKREAHDRGMNYLTIPNPLSKDALKEEPKFHPGNPGLEAEVVVEILQKLKAKHPDHFEQVSITGYSYGGLLSANVVRLDESNHTDSNRLITGGMFAVSPPENLHDSMLQLDGLRQQYKNGAGSIITRGLKYRREVKKRGYSNFPQSSLAQAGPGTNQTEIKISDVFGSRNGMKHMVDVVDKKFGHNKLPKDRQGGPRKPPGGSKRKAALERMTYAKYSEGWFANDSWLVERGLTPQEMAEKFSFTQAMGKIERTPILTVLSKDDYIINENNLDSFRDLEAQDQPLEKTKVISHGGHIGLLFNPNLSATIADFAFSTASNPERFD